MAAVKVPTGEAQRQAADAAPRDVAPHWSLAPSAWPGAETPVPYPARAWRTRVRLQVLSAWQAQLEALSHHDPDYIYDPGHEYAEDWTTDPAYRRDGVRLYRYDREGFLMPPGSFHSRFIDLVLQTLCLVLGRRVCREPDLHFPARLGADLCLLTQEGELRRRVVSDLAVMPRSWTLTEARERTVDERIIHMDEDDPAPELVVEVVSRSTEAKDFEDNLSLYAALGIPEYLLVDTGEFQTDPNMWLFRRAEPDGAYHVAERGLDLTVCGVPMRLRPAAVPGNVPVFQCRDADTRQWHDHEGSLERRGKVHTALQLLDAVLPSLPSPDRARIEASWQAAGLPVEAVPRILSLQGEPDRWRELLATPSVPEAAHESEHHPSSP
ncbi:MAG: Uma2 family endonuclease [Caldilineaceae bacterium SB0661_bin_34]|nr:Uma2 family endonuclease [Caldilineaceae bacterium SB0661_bin_34]